MSLKEINLLFDFIHFDSIPKLGITEGTRIASEEVRWELVCFCFFTCCEHLRDSGVNVSNMYGLKIIGVSHK